METYTYNWLRAYKWRKAWSNGMMTMSNGVKISWRNFNALIKLGVDMYKYDED